MGPSDLDLPVMPSAEQIRRKEFATARRGYDIDQVRDYLTQVSTQIEVLEREAHVTRRSEPPRAAGDRAGPEPVESAVDGGPTEPADADPYERLAQRFATMIRAADEESERLLAQAKEEAAAILDDARAQADRMRVDAQAAAEAARQEGREALERSQAEAARTLHGLAERRGSLVAQLHEMQAKLLRVAETLDLPAEELDTTALPPLQLSGIPEGYEVWTTRASAPASGTVAPEGEDILDPRYEDLWVSRSTVDIPDLTSIELDFEDDDRNGAR